MPQQWGVMDCDDDDERFLPIPAKTNMFLGLFIRHRIYTKALPFRASAGNRQYTYRSIHIRRTKQIGQSVLFWLGRGRQATVRQYFWQCTQHQPTAKRSRICGHLLNTSRFQIACKFLVQLHNVLQNSQTHLTENLTLSQTVY